MTILRKHYGYSKVDREDPDEIIHRRAQFLIYKAMEQVDSRGRRPPTSFARIRMCKLKIKIGRRLKKLRRSMLLSVSAARIAAYKQIITYLKTCKCLFSRHSSSTLATTLPIATIVT